jgi:hypothetical protein
MTDGCIKGDRIILSFSRSEALVFFEWLSRNWEKRQWKYPNLFSDPAKRQMLICLKGDLTSLITETFDPKYNELLLKAYREVLPEPSD